VPAVTPTAGVQVNAPDEERCLRQLTDPDERVRADSAMQLGRARSTRAVEPLTASLAGDRSPAVREASARALGLIGSSRALTALKRAVVADNDRDVRQSCQFSIEVIQTVGR
jgi:HEAT repeat protein